MNTAEVALEPSTPIAVQPATAPSGASTGRLDRRYVTAYLVILILAAILRVTRMVITSDDTFYPDEVFQLLEQAHRFAFGYGFVPWEFQIGLRSWLLPGMLGLILKGLDYLHLGTPEVYVPVVGFLSFAFSMTLVEAARRTADRLGGPLAGLFAAFSVAFYTASAAAALKMTPEVMAGYALAWALCFSLGSGSRSAWLAGVMIGLTAGLRVHYAPALVGLVITAYLYRNRNVGETLRLIVAAAATFLAFGILDWITWGLPFQSYIFAVWANVGKGVAASISVQPWSDYLTTFGFGSLALILAAFDFRRTWPALLVALLILLPHTLLAHKEPRFVFGMHEPTLVALAVFVAGRATAPRPSRLPLVAVALCIVIYAIRGLVVMALDPPYHAVLGRDIGAAVAEVRRQPSPAGLSVLTVHWGWFPGYYRLHMPIPVTFHKKPLTSVDQVDPGIDYVVVDFRNPVPAGFTFMNTYGTVSLWRVDHPRQALASGPSTAIPLDFSWDRGLHEVWQD
ncbi:hypothetical protein [Oryzibacter oryziterrae]|uniref:hypothetical protein n=1 Tax=Oryzibacter oryziterrae TaxID=2766474 RepID=UPI001F450D8C|nr:hypothetical protein [Oryzibacter oryziterrae]